MNESQPVASEEPQERLPDTLEPLAKAFAPIAAQWPGYEKIRSACKDSELTQVAGGGSYL